MLTPPVNKLDKSNTLMQIINNLENQAQLLHRTCRDFVQLGAWGNIRYSSNPAVGFEAYIAGQMWSNIFPFNKHLAGKETRLDAAVTPSAHVSGLRVDLQPLQLNRAAFKSHTSCSQKLLGG